VMVVYLHGSHVSAFVRLTSAYEGRKPEHRAYLKGLDVRTMSGRRRDIFLDILFIERNQARLRS
jgi:hypothetical protein